ncbi:hypothetical protein L1887_31546 [Cichorium endivia]|nr:hypothetical protein L1887_31546 [Cichorium endivia]
MPSLCASSPSSTSSLHIFELTPNLRVVEVKKKAGDKGEYDEFFDFGPRLLFIFPILVAFQLEGAAKPSLVNQVAYGLSFLEAFSTTVLKATEAGILSKARTPIINFVLGGPGVGKGTQCARIAETYGFTT